MGESASQQIDRLATFIMEQIPGEPRRSEGAVDTAIRLLSEARKAIAIHATHAYHCRQRAWLLGAFGVRDEYPERPSCDCWMAPFTEVALNKEGPGNDG